MLSHRCSLQEHEGPDHWSVLRLLYNIAYNDTPIRWCEALVFGRVVRSPSCSVILVRSGSDGSGGKPHTHTECIGRESQWQTIGRVSRRPASCFCFSVVRKPFGEIPYRPFPVAWKKGATPKRLTENGRRYRTPRDLPENKCQSRFGRFPIWLLAVIGIWARIQSRIRNFLWSPTMWRRQQSVVASWYFTRLFSELSSDHGPKRNVGLLRS